VTEEALEDTTLYGMMTDSHPRMPTVSSHAPARRELAIETADLVKTYGRTMRSGLSAHPNWGLIATSMGELLLLSAVSAWIASRAFRAYQRSI
jgi:hypothetical protein